MALVGYSDSEGSDQEDAPQPKVGATTSAKKPAFEKLVDSSGARKIKVDLPSVAPAAVKDEDRPAKKARTGGGFSSFNALLPAPKRTTEAPKRGGLGSGISLKTSSAAAFSRTPVDQPSHDGDAHQDTGGNDEARVTRHLPEGAITAADEVKVVGNAMRFKPLSVANKKKSKRPIPSNGTAADRGAQTGSAIAAVPVMPAVPPPKPKVSLFSVVAEEDPLVVPSTADGYMPMLTQEEVIEPVAASYETTAQQQVDPNTLDAVASDLNLSEADRRRLFGRKGPSAQAVNIANFNMDAEYTKNEQLRAAGEATQHRAVRAVAPGKHSLQQLVNAASTQKEALEDKWAEGKRNRGEAGNKYGWGR